jgi:hypothetical protein
MTAALSVALLLLMAVPEPGAPSLPAVDQLFTCPLNPEQQSFTPPDSWIAVTETSSGVSLQVPPTWTLDRQPHRLEIRAPDKSFRVSVRHSAQERAGGFEHARRSLEIHEMGPPFIHERCSQRVVQAIKHEAPWTGISFGYYGRPLGERRRRVALYAALKSGSIAVVISTRWPRGESGPDWSLVWSVLGGVRDGGAPVLQQVASETRTRLH